MNLLRKQEEEMAKKKVNENDPDIKIEL